jgi:hypothetical protein
MVTIDLSRPVHVLVTAFIAWKSFLLLIAIGSSLGSVYDTSTTLILPDASSPNESVFDLATKLTRWDAIYFVQSARRGYVFEQEWAFGMGLPTVISAVVKGAHNQIVFIGYRVETQAEHAWDTMLQLSFGRCSSENLGPGPPRAIQTANLIHSFRKSRLQ